MSQTYIDSWFEQVIKSVKIMIPHILSVNLEIKNRKFNKNINKYLNSEYINHLYNLFKYFNPYTLLEFY